MCAGTKPVADVCELLQVASTLLLVATSSGYLSEAWKLHRSKEALIKFAAQGAGA